MQTIAQALERLKSSRFRARFHLSDKEKAYVREKGMETIRAHAADLIAKRLAPPAGEIPNDGKQTPMRNHPVFVAQHACACCCRGCLEKWYKVPKERPLSKGEQERIVRLLMAWIEREMQQAPGGEE